MQLWLSLFDLDLNFSSHATNQAQNNQYGHKRQTNDRYDDGRKLQNQHKSPVRTAGQSCNFPSGSRNLSKRRSDSGFKEQKIRNATNTDADSSLN